MNCPFCAIVRGEAPAKITYVDCDVIAFEDIAPVAPFHELVVLRRHIESLASATDDDRALFGVSCSSGGGERTRPATGRAVSAWS